MFSTVSSYLAARYQPHTEALYKKWVYKLLLWEQKRLGGVHLEFSRIFQVDT